MTIYYNHSHDREACADCARQQDKWGPEDSCGRVHELKEGDKVTIRGGKAIWTVESAFPAIITVVRFRKDHRGYSPISYRRHFSNKYYRDDRQFSRITDLIPVSH